jgi:hypothetical protein
LGKHLPLLQNSIGAIVNHAHAEKTEDGEDDQEAKNDAQGQPWPDAYIVK